MLELWRALGQPARGRLILSLVLSAAAGASGVALLGLSGWFLTASALAGLAGAGFVFNHLYPSAGVRASAFARVLTRYGEQTVGHDATLALSARLRPEVFAAATRSRRGFSPLPAADLSAIIDDVEAAEAGFLRVVLPLAALAASAAIALAFAFAADLVSGLVALAVGLLAGVAWPLFVVRRARARAAELTELAEHGREETARLVENAVELDVIGALDGAIDQTRDRLSAWLDARRRQDLPFRQAAVLTGAAGAFAALFIVWRGVTGGADLALAVGAALALLSLMDAAAAMVAILNAANTSGHAARRLAARMHASDADWNPPESEAVEPGTLFPVIATGLLTRAADEARPIGPVDLRIETGQIVQLIGPSGSGKSTIAETLMRLHPIAGGELSYADIPAQKLRMASVLSRAAYAPQLPAFLPGTLADQLRLARPEATDADIAEALRVACADGFVTASPNGLETAFSDTELPFSGGELRRLGIARALLAEPELLILDEPLAGLDAPVAAQLAANLTAWMQAGRRSLLILAHIPQAQFSETPAGVVELKAV